MSVSSTSVYHGFLISKDFLRSSLEGGRGMGLWYFQGGIPSPSASGCWMQELLCVGCHRPHSCSVSRGSSLRVDRDK